MKNFTYFLMFFMLSYHGYSQIQIGNGATIDKHTPFEPPSNYSYTQSIYTATEINASGTITGIKWYFDGVSALTHSNITIYLGHTSKSEFTDNMDWETTDNFTEVFNGTIQNVAAGWVSIPFIAPFSYNGTDNLIIAVNDGGADNDNNADKFFTHQVSGNRSLVYIDPITATDISMPANAIFIENYVPNIIFTGISQLCPYPQNVSVTAVSPSTAKVSWDALSTPASDGSEYYFSESSQAPETLTMPSGSIVSGTTAQVSGLIEGTHYYIWVRNKCNGVAGTWSYAKEFNTPCNPLSAFNESFDTTIPASGSLPDCWSSLKKGAGISEFSHVEVVGYNAHSAENAIELFNDLSTPSSDIILASPYLSNLGAGTHRLKFFANNGFNSATIEVGTLNALADDAVFTHIQTVPLTGEYTEFVVTFPAGTDKYIGFRLDTEYPFVSVYVDDIRWEQAPPCPDIIQINAPVTTVTTATATWVPASNETQWTVAYALSSETDPGAATQQNASVDPQALLTGLSANTSYNIWVRSVCSAGEGIWIGPISFTTACVAVTALNENFDTIENGELPGCWTSIIRGATVATDATVITTIYNVNSGRSVMLNNGYSESYTGDDIILASPNLGNLASGTQRLKFYVKKPYGESSLQVGTLNTNTAAATFTPLAPTIEVTGTATEHTISFSAYTGTDNYIGFRLNSDSGATISLDDIRWEIEPACADVTHITVPSYTAESVTLNWIPGDTETQWEVATASSSVNDPNTLTPSGPYSSPTATITGLNPDTVYKIWVRSDCGANGGNGAWIGPVYTHTECLATDSFNENFDEVSTPALPGCWTALLRGATISSAAIIHTVGNISVSSPNAIRLYAANSSADNDIILVSPKVNSLILGSHRLKFDVRGSTGGTLQIGTLNSNAADATFTQIDEMTPGVEFSQYIIDLSDYPSEDTYIGLRLNASSVFNAVFIDNIVWETVPLCPDITEIAVFEVTATTADLSWSGTNGESASQIAYGNVDVTDPDTLIPGEIITSNSIQLTALQGDTTYKAWIRSVCAAPFGNGSWSSAVTFTTKCQPTTVPYLEDFETSTEPELPNCSSSFNAGVIDNNWATRNNPAPGFSNQALYYGGGYDAVSDAWFFSRGLNLLANTSYTLSYDYSNIGYNTTEAFKVMYGTTADVTSMSTLVANHPQVTGETFQTALSTFTVPVDGTYFIGFNVYSMAIQGSLVIDNIAVDTTLSNNVTEDNPFAFYPNPVTAVLNLSYKQSISAVTVYNMLGQKIIENNPDNTIVRLDMSKVPSGSYIVRITSGNLIKSINVIKQ